MSRTVAAALICDINDRQVNGHMRIQTGGATSTFNLLHKEQNKPKIYVKKQ